MFSQTIAYYTSLWHLVEGDHHLIRGHRGYGMGTTKVASSVVKRVDEANTFCRELWGMQEGFRGANVTIDMLAVSV